jgi:hypothetical protein
MPALLCDSPIAKKRNHVQQKMITAGKFHQYCPLVDLVPRFPKTPHISLALKGMSPTATFDSARGKPIWLLSMGFMITVSKYSVNPVKTGCSWLTE